MASITVERLSKVFDGGVAAVRDLDLEIRDGELLVLVGGSGCGKTTTLRMIAGLEPPTAGTIRIGERDVTELPPGERDVTELPPGERDVAMVFQSYALYPHMSVFENLAFGLRVRRTARAELERRVREVAGLLGLDALLKRKPAALSGGQRQRVALGRALVREPRVFLFDEPLSNLDARLRVQMRGELAALHRRLGTTMVYVTHDQTEAMTLGTRVAVMHEGALQQLAPPLEVYDRPANLAVAALIGSPAMNLIPCRLTREAGGLRVLADDLTLAWPGAGPGGGGGGGGGGDAAGGAGGGAGAAGASWAGGGGGAAGAAEPADPAGALGPEVVLGVRPEHLMLGPADGTEDLRAVVRVIEPLGSETIVHCRAAAGAEVAVRVAGRADLRADGVVGLRLDRSRLHLFDARSGERVDG